MDRRAFLGILTGGVQALPVAIEAQRPKVAKDGDAPQAGG